MASKTLFRNADSTKHVLFAFQRSVGGFSLVRAFMNSAEWTEVENSNTDTGKELFGGTRIRETGKKSSLETTYPNLKIVTVKRNPYNKFISGLAYLNIKHGKTFTPDQLLTADDMSSDSDACWYNQCTHTNPPESITDLNTCVNGAGRFLWDLQHKLYYNDADQSVADYVISYENFTTEWSSFASDIGGDIPTFDITDKLTEFESESDDAELERILATVTDATKTKIYNKFREDFDKLGYASTDWTY